MITALIGWAMVHPKVVSLCWMLVTAFLTAMFKPRTPEQYAAFPPRIAATLKLLSALGIDPLKAVEAIKQIVSGTAKHSEEMK